MSDHTLRIHGLDPAVRDLDPDRLAAVEAHRINAYRPAREEPADRQRLKGSLTEPPLLSLHRQAVLGREVVERRK
jgi:hypothetical protein